MDYWLDQDSWDGDEPWYDFVGRRWAETQGDAYLGYVIDIDRHELKIYSSKFGAIDTYELDIDELGTPW